MIILVMGVGGVGKTTVGTALASALGWRFEDADDYHSAANVAKMRAGIPLTDDDRAPWLQSLHDSIVTWRTEGQNVVLACSALKTAYREKLMVSPDVRLVYLAGDPALVAERMRERPQHYMNPGLLRSQFETLEEPLDAITIDASLPVAAIVSQIRHEIAL